MPVFKVLNPNFREAIEANFQRQTVMHSFAVVIRSIEAGRVELQMPYQATLTQQHGFLHAGINTTLLDSACGYAALTLMPANADVLSIEFKVNLLSPAVGDSFVAKAEVVRSGKTITVCRAELEAHQGNEQKTVAVMQATMMTVISAA